MSALADRKRFAFPLLGHSRRLWHIFDRGRHTQAINDMEVGEYGLKTEPKYYRSRCARDLCCRYRMLAAANAVEEQAREPPLQVYVGIVGIPEESRATAVVAGFSAAGGRVNTANDIVN